MSSSSSFNRRLLRLVNTRPSATTETIRTAIRTSTTSTSVKPPRPKNKQYEKLVENFKLNCESRRFRFRKDIYESTVRRLAAGHKTSMIVDILEAQKKYENIKDEGFAVRLIALYGIAGMYNHARKLFDELPDLKCERTVKSFNTLLSACVNAKEYGKALEIFHELPEKLSIKVNIVSYNIVINAFCSRNDIDSAIWVFHELEKKEMESDLATFNTLLASLYRAGQFSEGEKFWGIMESKKIEPNIVSYNSRLTGMMKNKRTTEALSLLDEMEMKGIKRDRSSFNALIKEFCDSGNLEEAKRWYGEMKKNECVPNNTTYMALIPCLCENSDFDMAFEVCVESIDLRVAIGRMVFNRVVDGLVMEEKIEEARKLVELGNSVKFCNYRLDSPLIST